MVQDFQTFIKNMLEGHGMNAPTVQAPVARNVIEDMNAYNQYMQAQQATPPPPVAPVQAYAPPVVQNLPQSPVMDPRAFAAFQQQQQAVQTQQGPVQGPMPVTTPITAPAAEPVIEDEYPYNGAWQTVEYKSSEGVTYYILMPVQNTVTIPEGANLVGEPIVNNPDAVREAQQVGEIDAQNPTATAKRGLLTQMPPDVQIMFQSSQDAYQQGGVIAPTGTGENLVPPGTTQPTTPVPQVNAQGQGPDEVQQQSRDFDQMMRDMATTPPDQFMAEQRNNNQEALTVTQLAKTNPEGAALLQANGITSIRADQMAVQYEGGQISLVPASETPPAGATIITYGGDTSPPTSKEETLGGLETVMNALEWPQRQAQSLFSQATDIVPDWMQQAILSQIQNSPMGVGQSILSGDMPFQGSDVSQTLYGFPAFAQWLQENPDVAGMVEASGYNGFTGQRAVWERFQEDRNTFERLMDSTLTDPLNAFPSMGAPVRGVAEMVGRRAVREGVEDVARMGVDDAIEIAARRGATDVVEQAPRSADEIADTVFQNAPEDFASAPNVTTEPPIIRRGVGEIDESVPATNELVTGPTVVNPAQQAANVNRGFQVTSDVLNQVANTLDIPENVLGAVVDKLMEGGGRGLRLFGDIPVGDGRQLSDLFRTTDQSIVREGSEEVRTQLEDVRGQRVVDRATPPPVTQAVTPPRTPQFEEITLPNGQTISVDINAPDADTSFSRAAEATRPQEPLAVDRPVTDLGRPADEAVEPSTQPLAVDRPIESVGETAPIAEEPALARDAEFRATDIGRRTEEQISRWPDYAKPQTTFQRAIGEDRIGRDFAVRPQDTARILAPQYPEQWQKFVRSVTGSMKRLGDVDAARKATQYRDIVSTRFGKQVGGFDVKRAVEVLQEARNYVEQVGPAFIKNFGEDAELPRWSWKRYTDGGEQHSFGDFLASSEPGANPSFPEMVEAAIFSPEADVRQSWLNEIEQRLGIRDDAGATKRTVRGDALYRKDLPKDLKGAFAQIKRYGDAYQKLLADDAAIAARNTERLSTDDVARLSGQTTDVTPGQAQQVRLPRTGEEGQDIYERDFADTLAQDRGPEPVTPPPSAETGEDVYERDLAASFADEGSQSPVTSPIAPGSNANPVKRLIGRSMDVDQAAIPTGPTTPVTGVREEPNLIQGADTPPLVQRQNAGTSPMGRPVEVDQTAISADLPPGQAEAVAERESYEDAVRAYLARRGGRTPDINAAETIEPVPGTREGKRAEYLRGKSETRVREMQNRSTPMTREELDSFYVRGRAPGATQARVLGQRFSRGDSILERWDRYTDEYLRGADTPGQRKLEFGGTEPAATTPRMSIEEAEEQAAKRVVGDYTVEILSDKMRVRYEAEYRALLGKEYEDELTGKMVKRSPLDAQITALQRTLNRTTDSKFWRKYDQIMSALRKTFLYNWLTGPRYITTQMAGNSITAGLTGNTNVLGDIMSPDAIRRSWRTAHNEGMLPDSIMDQARGEYGLGGDRELTKGSIITRDQTLDDAGKVKPGNSLLGKWMPFIADKRVQQMSAAYDQMSREALWTRQMDYNLLVPRRELRDRILASVPNGVDAAQVQQAFDALPQRFSSSDLRDTFGPMDATWADRQARDWQEALTKTDIAARDEVKRVYFGGTERNADIALKRVLFFHYWTSRAIPLYSEAIARNPVFLYNFAKMIETMQDDDDLSGTQFAKFFSTPMGYNILIRPDAFFSTFASFAEDAGYEPDGESTLGKILRKSPIMLNPIIQMAFNLAGTMGNTFGPDPVGANKWIGLAQAGIDNANAQFGWNLPPAGNPQEYMMRHGREWISRGTSAVLPDWVAQHVPYADSMAYKENEVRSLVAEIALERGMSLDDPIVQAAMVDPESELYQEAMKKYALQDAADIAMRIIPVTSVLYPKSQLASPKERSAAITAEKESSQNAGMTQTTPRGQQLMTERDTIAAASDYSRTIQQQQDEYRQLGSPEARGAWSFYNNIKYGSLEQPITVSGQEYAAGDVAAMDDAQRETLANTWATEAGVADMIKEVQTQRKAYRDSHPEIAEYTTWSAQVNDSDNEFGGDAELWAQATAEGNPNFARWLAENPIEEEINGRRLSEREKKDRREQQLTSLQAYMAYRADQMAYWENDPIANRTAVDPNPYNPMDTGTGDETSSSTTTSSEPKGPTEQGILDSYAQYEADMVAYNAAASQMLGQEVNVDWLNPQAKQAVEYNLGTLGFSKPYLGGYAADYLQWMNQQGSGDTSIPAYLAWYAQRNPQAVPTQPTVSP